jgi:hypothetical protein
MTTFDKYVEGTDIMNYVTNTIAQLTGAVKALESATGGAAGGAINSVTVEVTWDGGSQQPVATVPANSAVLAAFVVITETWDGSGASLEIASRDAAVCSELDVLTAGEVYSGDQCFFQTQTPIYAWVTAGVGATTGRANAYLIYTAMS